MPEPNRRVACAGAFDLPIAPDDAFPLFTARGECGWVPGWSPTYVYPADGTLETDQVWTTPGEEGQPDTIWTTVHLDRDAREVHYLRTSPGTKLARVAVRVLARDAGSRVEVGYVWTALDPDRVPELEAFAAGYDDMMGEWRRLVMEWWSARDS